MTATYSVLILDMAHYQDPDHEIQVSGFPTLEAAQEFARRRVRASIEELRSPEMSPEELRRLWHLYGEDALVPGAGWAASHELDQFLAAPAGPEETDWASLDPRKQ